MITTVEGTQGSGMTLTIDMELLDRERIRIDRLEKLSRNLEEVDRRGISQSYQESSQAFVLYLRRESE